MGDPNGITKFAERLKAKYEIAGRLFFVSNSTVPMYGGVVGSNNSSNGTSELQPLATIDYAIGLCTASRGDAIFVLPFHAETVTTSITLDVAGVQIIGLHAGTKRPKVTVNGATDAMTITAAGCSVRGLEFAIITTDAATSFVNIAASNTLLHDLYMIPSSGTENVVDCITVASGNDCRIDSCQIYNTTVAVNSFVSIESAVARLKIKNNFFFGDVATAGIIDAAAATQIWINDNTIGTIGTTIPCAILDSNPTGVVDNNRFLGTHTTIASNAQLGNLLRQARSFVLEATDNSVQATDIIPPKDTE